MTALPFTAVSGNIYKISVGNKDGFELPDPLSSGRPVFLLTDRHIAAHYPFVCQGYPVIVLEPGEEAKTPETVVQVCSRLLELGADRNSLLVGIGGGVVTDIAGFVGAVFMRGIRFGFIPTSLLGMVDAAIGGKNGVNIGLYKNMMGTVHQPEFILQDIAFLNTLPLAEWKNGFAEIIKYGCIFDKDLLSALQQKDIHYYRQHVAELVRLIDRCAAWKCQTVEIDERETGKRKLLNFGHTAGHALETLYHLPHGAAVAVGMILACRLSEQLCGLPAHDTLQIKEIISRYDLPVSYDFHAEELFQVIKGDKKRTGEGIDYILLNKAGEGTVRFVKEKLLEGFFLEYARSK